MTPDAAETRAIETATRALATAAKAMRLYPPTSVIPREAVASAVDALQVAIASQPMLPLVVARDGFTHRGTALSALGAAELARMLTDHGVAEVSFMPQCTTQELCDFLGIVLRDPAVLRADGGMASALAGAEVGSVVVSEVALTALVGEAPVAEELDDFLRALVADPGQLAAWLTAAVKGDPGALSDGLLELARAAGPDGAGALVRVLGVAFLAQDTAGKDTLIGLALGQSEVATLLCSMLQSLRSNDLALALSSGLYGANMLSLSHVLTALPFGDRLESILEEIRPLLTESGREERELDFLHHMIEVRDSAANEAALSESVPDYQTVATLSDVGEADLGRAHAELEASAGTVGIRTIRTMLSLLDQQQDFELWSRTLSGLASVVPSLFARREFALADRVLADIATREARTTKPWPGLAEQVRQALDRATSAEAMGALLSGVVDDPRIAETAREILRRVGTAAQQRLVLIALRSDDTGLLGVAEGLLGRAIVDLLVGLAPHAEPSQVAPIAERLSKESDARPRRALESLTRRSDAQSRAEVARGLARSAAPAAVQTLAALASDASVDVAAAAVRGLGSSPAPGAAAALGALFAALDTEGKDFPMAREVLGALARAQDPAATGILARIAARRALIKRGHFAEVQDLAARALAMRSVEGADR